MSWHTFKATSRFSKIPDPFPFSILLHLPKEISKWHGLTRTNSILISAATEFYLFPWNLNLLSLTSLYFIYLKSSFLFISNYPSVLPDMKWIDVKWVTLTYLIRIAIFIKDGKMNLLKSETLLNDQSFLYETLTRYTLAFQAFKRPPPSRN